MMNKRLFLLLVLLLPFLFVGCWDENQPERMYYVHGLGVDYKEDQYEVFLQIIDFSNIAKSEQPNPEAVQAEIGISKGKTIDEAFFNLYHSIDERIFWGHLTYLIFSEKALQQNTVLPTLNALTRYRETRYKVWVYGTDDEVKNIMLATPILNKAITLSKLADPKNSYAQESNVPPINIRELLIQINEPGHEATILRVQLKENWETEKGKSEATDLSGVGIITDKEFKGFLKDEQVEGLRWMTEETVRTNIVSTINGQPFVAVLTKLKVSIDPTKTDGPPKFTINVSVQATMSDFIGDVTTAEITKAIEKKIEENIRKTYMEGLQIEADLYRFSEILYRQQLKKWKAYEVNGKIPLTEQSIHSINVTVEKMNLGRKNFEYIVD